MSQFRYVKPQTIRLKNHAQLTEKWVQARIAEDPSILGLGDIVLRDQERIQPGAGRLDLLLQDSESNLRYVVELQLGATDESHIIRAIEYWDIERKRYPQYDHVAVLVAEDITSRFLNVVSLLNGVIPLVAMQMNAISVGDMTSLIFTTVLDQRVLRSGTDEEEVKEVTDRAYWEKRGTPATVRMADEIQEIIRTFDKSLVLKYNKFYIGISRDNRAANFALMLALKRALRLEFRIERSEEIELLLQEAGLDLTSYSARTGYYAVRLVEGDIDRHRDLLANVLKTAYDEYGAWR